MVRMTSSGSDFRLCVRTTMVRRRRAVAFLVSASVVAEASFLSFLENKVYVVHERFDQTKVNYSEKKTAQVL